MSDYTIIIIVTVFALVGCAIMALAVYLIDKNADRYDRNSNG